MWKTEISEQQLGYVCGSESLTNLITSNFTVANILIFETTGSFFIAYGFVTYGGFADDLSYPYIYVLLTGGIYFASLLWSGRYCMPTLNPVVTLAHILKSEKKIIPLMGSLYLACQFLGTLAGAALGFSLLRAHDDVPAIVYLTNAIYSCSAVSAFFQSFLSTFVYVVVVLIMITPSLSFTEIDLQVWFTMMLLYGITAVLGNSPLGCNFFLTLVISFLGGCYGDSWEMMHRVWGFILGPILGSLAGILFFQYFYQPIAEAFQEEVVEETTQFNKKEEQVRRQRQRTVLEIA